MLLQKGKQLYLYTNESIRKIPNWQTFLAMHRDVDEVTFLTEETFRSFREGPSMPEI